MNFGLYLETQRTILNINKHLAQFVLIGGIMPNKVFQTVVENMDFVGDILSKGITKKGVVNEDADPENVTVPQMKRALNNHIVPALYSFVSEKKAKEWKRKIFNELSRLEGEN